MSTIGHSSAEIGKTVLWMVAIVAFVIIMLTKVPDWISPAGTNGTGNGAGCRRRPHRQDDSVNDDPLAYSTAASSFREARGLALIADFQKVTLDPPPPPRCRDNEAE